MEVAAGADDLGLVGPEQLWMTFSNRYGGRPPGDTAITSPGSPQLVHSDKVGDAAHAITRAHSPTAGETIAHDMNTRWANPLEGFQSRPPNHPLHGGSRHR